MEIVNLTKTSTIEQIQSFNERFIPEKRLSDSQFLKWKYRSPSSDGQEITSHIGIVDAEKIVAQISV
ncbi:MAG: hypothetical protein IIC32_07365, partial [Chloroflexi bacterium]|nr:hypothetical protein [Chloroflexota bacterium]